MYTTINNLIESVTNEIYQNESLQQALGYAIVRLSRFSIAHSSDSTFSEQISEFHSDWNSPSIAIVARTDERLEDSFFLSFIQRCGTQTGGVAPLSLRIVTDLLREWTVTEDLESLVEFQLTDPVESLIATLTTISDRRIASMVLVAGLLLIWLTRVCHSFNRITVIDDLHMAISNFLIALDSFNWEQAADSHLHSMGGQN